MNLVGILKGVGELVVSIGVGAIVSNAIKMTTSSDISVYKKAAIAVGSIALSAMVADKTSSYVTSQAVDIHEQLVSLVK